MWEDIQTWVWSFKSQWYLVSFPSPKCVFMHRGCLLATFGSCSLKSSRYYTSLYVHQRCAAVCKLCVCLSTIFVRDLSLYVLGWRTWRRGEKGLGMNEDREAWTNGCLPSISLRSCNLSGLLSQSILHVLIRILFISPALQLRKSLTLQWLK